MVAAVRHENVLNYEMKHSTYDAQVYKYSPEQFS